MGRLEKRRFEKTRLLGALWLEIELIMSCILQCSVAVE